MLKKFKNMEGPCRLDLPSIFKIELNKCLKKFSALKNASLSSLQFKLIKTVCKSNEEPFSQKKNFTNGFINHYRFKLFPSFVAWNFFGARKYLSPRDFFFLRETFSISARLFLLVRDFFSLARMFLAKVKISGQP